MTDRLLPDEALPSYAFIPGRFPHPESDPAGHSFGIARSAPSFDPANWFDCRVYLRGLDLFNAGYLWESHVEFESLWIACGRKGRFADFFKGLIHLAAAGVKHHEGVPAGVHSHATRAAELWRGIVEGQERLLGFSLQELIAIAEAIDREGWPVPGPVLVPRFPKTLS